MFASGLIAIICAVALVVPRVAWLLAAPANGGVSGTSFYVDPLSEIEIHGDIIERTGSILAVRAGGTLVVRDHGRETQHAHLEVIYMNTRYGIDERIPIQLQDTVGRLYVRAKNNGVSASRVWQVVVKSVDDPKGL